MGRTHAFFVQLDARTAPHRTAGRTTIVRSLDVAVGSVLLLVALPVMLAVAAAVRLSSHGTVLHREAGLDRLNQRVQLLSFRTLVDGGASDAHARLRAVIGAEDELPLTAVGRVIRAVRLDRLPRLINVVAGHRSLFG